MGIGRVDLEAVGFGDEEVGGVGGEEGELDCVTDAGGVVDGGEVGHGGGVSIGGGDGESLMRWRVFVEYSCATLGCCVLLQLLLVVL